MRVGVLALQGDFAEHMQMLLQLRVDAVEVKLPSDLTGLDALIMPGGESTTFAKLAERFALMPPLRDFIKSGKPTWGTCAGLIFMATDVGRDQPTLGVMDIKVKRNAFGRQVDSFISPVRISGLADPYEAIFIRAPLIESVGPDVEVMATLPDGAIVAARQGNMLVTSFHPELTRDNRVHSLFLKF